MNEHQKHLLGLLKEIDYICRKYSITYYAAGGTVIGAVRHKGFIPWDDDIDIYMTSADFNLFRKAFSKEKLPDRKLEYVKDNDKFYATIPRYNEETTTHICRYHILGQASGGLLIDILIMDNFPNDRQAQKEYLAKLNVYADLIAIPYTHSQRNEDDFLQYYDEYSNKVAKQGRKAVIDELENELFSYNDNASDNYILRWAAVPVILPKKIMGKPCLLEFEDMMIPVPEDWYGYLTLLYGSDWMNVPYAAGQETHITISNIETPYKLFYEERDKYISQKKALQIYQKRKKAAVKLQYSRRPIEKHILDVKVRIALYLQAQVLEKSTASIECLYRQKQYHDIVELYSVYISRQTSVLFVGRLKHANWNRWVSPLIIPIEDETLEMILKSMIMIGDDKRANKIITAYERAGIKSQAVLCAKELYEKLIEIEKLYYLQKYKECIRKIKEFPNSRDNAKCNNYYWLSKVNCCSGPQIGELLKRKLEEENCATELYKAYGDYLFSGKNFEEAKEVYDYVLENSRNGLFWLDIQAKTGQTTGVMYEDSFSPSPIELKEQELLSEIHNLCEENNISYVLSGHWAKRLILKGNLGYGNKAKTIYMNAENAIKFINAFNDAKLNSRKLISWENNTKLRDFKIVYSDTESVYANFNHFEEWEGIGIHVNIVILRNANMAFLNKKIALLLEIILNVYNLEDIDKPVLRNAFRKTAYYLCCFLMKIIGVKRYCKFLYHYIMQKELSSSSEGYFFRKNRSHGIYKDVPLIKRFFEEKRKCHDEKNDYYVSNKFEKENIFTREKDEFTNEPYDESLFVLRSTDLTWEELIRIIDQKKLLSYDWYEYGRDRRALSKIEKQVKDMWVTMIRGEDKFEYIKLYDEYISNGDNIDDFLYEYDKVFKFYWRKKRLFILDDDITGKYINYLRKNGEETLAQSIYKKMVKK